MLRVADRVDVQVAEVDAELDDLTHEPDGRVVRHRVQVVRARPPQHPRRDLLRVQHANAPAEEAGGTQVGPQRLALGLGEGLRVGEAHRLELVQVGHAAVRGTVHLPKKVRSRSREASGASGRARMHTIGPSVGPRPASSIPIITSSWGAGERAWMRGTEAGAGWGGRSAWEERSSSTQPSSGMQQVALRPAESAATHLGVVRSG